jgi:hypothetical protein
LRLTGDTPTLVDCNSVNLPLKNSCNHATASFNTFRCATECKSQYLIYKKYKFISAELTKGERQLRSGITATGAEAAPRDSESCRDIRELVCNISESETLRNKRSNAQIEVQIGGEEQSPDNYVNYPEKSDDKIVMFSKQLESFTKSVREDFDNLK